MTAVEHVTHKLIEVRSDYANCGLCHRDAKRVAIVRRYVNGVVDGPDMGVAHKCARILLGFNPFVSKG